MSLIKYIAIAALLLFALVLALIGILSVTHDTPVRNVIAEGDKDGPPSIADSLFSRSIELYNGTHIDPGNTVQMYYSQPGAVADTMAKYLIEKARQKVRVLLLLDAFGSQPLKREWLQRVKAARVRGRWRRPLPRSS